MTGSGPARWIHAVSDSPWWSIGWAAVCMLFWFWAGHRLWKAKDVLRAAKRRQWWVVRPRAVRPRVVERTRTMNRDLLAPLVAIYVNGPDLVRQVPEKFIAEVVGEIEMGREIAGVLGEIRHLVAGHWDDEGTREYILKRIDEARAVMALPTWSDRSASDRLAPAPCPWAGVPVDPVAHAREEKGALHVPLDVWNEFHRAWTADVGTPGYDKKAWQKNEFELLDRYGGDAARDVEKKRP